MDYTGNCLRQNLTNREHEILRYMTKGKTDKEIAEILMITHHTVKAHRVSIERKNYAHKQGF